MSVPWRSGGTLFQMALSWQYIEEYTAAKAKQTAKAKEAEKRVLYL